MRTRIVMLVAALSAVAALAVGPAQSATGKAVCTVCRVMRGETEAEPVKAVREYQGTRYGLCSTKCAKEFDADPAAFVPPVLPRPAPAFALEDLSGGPLSNDALKGTVVLLDFWATWCAPCRKSMPGLQALHDEYAARGFRVVGVSIDEDGRDKVAAYVAGRKLTYPIALDAKANPAWEAFRVKAVPAAYLIDREGRSVAQWTGAAADARELRSRIESLLAAD